MFQATTKRIFSKLDNLQKMLEKIMKNQEKMQDDIKSVKEEVAILSYDQDCVYVSKDIKF
jgi:regulator of replication initiation timing